MTQQSALSQAYEALMMRHIVNGPLPYDPNPKRYVVIERDINDHSGFRRLSSQDDLEGVDAWIAGSGSDLAEYEVIEVWDLVNNVSVYNPQRHARSK